MKTFCMAATFAVSLLTVAEAKHKKMPGVELPIEIDQTNFMDLVLDPITEELKGDTPWFIEFFAPWCPHCQHLAPVWDQFYRDNKETLNVARVDCTSDDGKSLCRKFMIRSYPTLLYFPVG